MHSRRILFSEGELEIVDEINKNNHLGYVRFHTNPRVKLSISKCGSHGFLICQDGSEVVWETDADLVFEEDNEYAFELEKKYL